MFFSSSETVSKVTTPYELEDAKVQGDLSSDFFLSNTTSNDYDMDGPVGFLRFGEGTLAICGPGSSRIVKFQRNLKVLGLE